MATTREERSVFVEPVIAKQDVDVQDPATTDPLHKRRILAGQPVPPDLLEAYTAATGKAATKAERAPEVDKAERAPQRAK